MHSNKSDKNSLNKKYHRPIYYHAELPFSFLQKCSDGKDYQVELKFSYTYSAENNDRPSVFAENYTLRRFNLLLNRSFMDFLKQYSNQDFPLEWLQALEENKKWCGKKHPPRNEKVLNEYYSSLLQGAFVWYLSNIDKAQINRFHYLQEQLRIERWSLCIESCAGVKPFYYQKPSRRRRSSEREREE